MKTEIKVMCNGVEHVFYFLPCPFSGKAPKVTIDKPKDWSGTVWAWVRSEHTSITVHHGCYSCMRYNDYSGGTVEYQTAEEAALGAITRLERDWNTRG